MLPSIDAYLHARNLRYNLIPSRDIDDRRIPYDWMMSGITGLIKPKVVVSDAIFHWSLSSCKKSMYRLIPSRNISDQGILQSDWMSATTGHTQQNIVALDATTIHKIIETNSSFHVK